MAMITITIHPQTPAHIAVLAEAMTKLVTDQDAPVTDQDAPVAEAAAAAPAPAEAAPTPKRGKASKPVATQEVSAPEAPTPGQSPAAQTTAPAEEGNAAAAPSEPEAAAASTASSSAPAAAAEYTLEVVRAKLASLSQAGKADKVKGLIAQFGVAKLTDIKAEQYGDLMAKAEAL